MSNTELVMCFIVELAILLMSSMWFPLLVRGTKKHWKRYTATLKIFIWILIQETADTKTPGVSASVAGEEDAHVVVLIGF